MNPTMIESNHLKMLQASERCEYNIVKGAEDVDYCRVYSTRLSRKVQSLYEDGCSIQQIMDETGLKKSSVHGYLPYIKGNYNLPEVTLDAEYSRVYRKRISVCERLRREIDSPDAEEYLWDAIVAYVDYSFITEKGLSLKYTVQGGEIFFNRKKKSVTRATVMKAFHRTRQLQHEKGFVSGPKELGTFGASYIYPVFLRIGVCVKKSEKIFENVYSRESKNF